MNEKDIDFWMDTMIGQFTVMPPEPTKERIRTVVGLIFDTAETKGYREGHSHGVEEGERRGYTKGWRAAYLEATREREANE